MSSLSQKAISLAIIIAFCGFSTGCGQMQTKFQDTFASDDPCSNNARNIGTLIGAIGGAILGNVISKDNRAAGTAIGAFTGGLVGGLIGYDIDRRRCELYKIAKANDMDLKMRDLNAVDSQGNQEISGMSAQIITDEQFLSGSETPTPKAQWAFTQMARQYQSSKQNTNTKLQGDLQSRDSKMRILLVGHTDDSGDSQNNADLSEKRARAVAQIFAREGWDSNQIYYQGAGDTLPIADNRTEEGRRQNRRVEIVDLSSDAAFAAYLQSRQPNTSYYRPKERKAMAMRDQEVIQKDLQEAPKETTKSVSKPFIVSAPKSKTAAAKPVVVSAPTSAKRSVAGNFFDFGGNDTAVKLSSVDIGKLQTIKSGGFFIKEAVASTNNVVASCLDDNYHAANGVKSLSTDEVASLKTSDYLPGFYQTSWAQEINGHLVALKNVGVLRDGGSPANKPDLLVYRDYQGNDKAVADFKTRPNVNAYQGEKGVLYRVFVDEKNAPIYCIDLVLNNQGSVSPQSNLIYIKEGKEYQVPYVPRMARN